MYSNIFNQSEVSRSSEENDEEEINSRPKEYENYLDFQVISNYSTNIHHMDHNPFEQEQISEQNTAGTNPIQSRYIEVIQWLNLNARQVVGNMNI